MESFKLGKIDMIKLVRKMVDLGLVDSKTLVEAWLTAMDLDGVYSLDQLKAFWNFVGPFVRGQYVVDGTNLRPAVPQTLSFADIRKLSE